MASRIVGENCQRMVYGENHADHFERFVYGFISARAAHAFATSKCGRGTFLPERRVGVFLRFLHAFSETQWRFATDEISPEDEGYLILSKGI